MSLWTIRKGNIQTYEGLSQEERTRAYAEGELEPCRNPWMNLDYDSWDTWVEETADDFFQQPREKRSKKAVSATLHLKRIVNPGQRVQCRWYPLGNG